MQIIRHPHWLILALLLGLCSPLWAEDTPAPQRDWLAAPNAPEPSPQDPQLELFPNAKGLGIPDEHGISSELREAIRQESERALHPVTEDLSTL